EGRYPRVGTSLKVRGGRRSSFVGATEQREGRCKERVRRQVFRIGVERTDQRADGLLIAPEKNESMPATVQPGPPPRIAWADSIGLSKPIEGLFCPAEIHGRQADFLVGPWLT